MRTTDVFSQSDETICETMIPGMVNDELGPATTIDEPDIMSADICGARLRPNGL